MSELKFVIYIGEKIFSGQASNIVAIAEPQFFVPRGKYKLDGSETGTSMDCFVRLYDLATYIADWIDLCEDEKLVTATIILNKPSLKKVFRGKEITEMIDRINLIANYKDVKSFDEIK